MSPEPVSNWTLSLAEDSLAVFLAWMAATHPLLTAGIVVVLVVLAVLLIWQLFRFFRQVIAIRRRGESSADDERARGTHPGRRSHPSRARILPPTPSPSRRAADPSRTAISTAPPEPTYASSPPVGTSPKVRRSGPMSRPSTSNDGVRRHHLGT